MAVVAGACTGSNLNGNGMRNVASLVALAALMAAVIAFCWCAANSIPVLYKAPVLMP